MKKIPFILFYFFCFLNSFGNIVDTIPIVPRSNDKIYVQDGRLFPKLNFNVPIFADSTAANNSIGNDYAGAIIYVQDLNVMLYRQANPNKWVVFSGGSIGVPTWQQTLDATNGSVITRNNTITGSFGLNFSGLNSFKVIKNGIGTTQTDSTGIILKNSTLATSLLNQMPPGLVWYGGVWTSGGGGSNKVLKFRADVLPTVGRGIWQLSSSINGGAYQTLFSIDNNATIQQYYLNMQGVFVGSPDVNQDNIFLGLSALNGGNTGHRNTAIGTFTIGSNTAGSDNTAVGYSALFNNTVNGFNTAVGSNSMYFTTTGDQNTAIGGNSLLNNTTGQKNVSVGAGNLENNTTGSFNNAVGEDALLHNTTGRYLTAMGWLALGANTTGDSSVAIGSSAGQNITTGKANTFLGTLSGTGITTGSYNTIIGANVTGLSPTLTSNIILNDGQGHIRLQFNGNGQATLPAYVSGAFTGTAAYDLQVDANGQVIMGSIGAVSIGTINSQTTNSNGLRIIGTAIYPYTSRYNFPYPGFMDSSQVKRLDSSTHVTVDSTYNPIGGFTNDSSIFFKSDRFQLDGVTVSPTISSTTRSWNFSTAAAGLTVGTSVITGGGTTKILYDNAGVLGEYGVVGSGLTVAMSTTPTFTTSIIDPLVIGGINTTSTLTFKTTTGVGTTNADMIFLVGNNGGTEAMRILNSGNIGIGVSPSYKLDVLTSDAGLFAANIYNSNTGVGTSGLNVAVNHSGTGHIFEASGGSGGTTPKFDVLGNGAILFSNDAGTAGYVLKSNGNAAAPTWVSPTGLSSSLTVGTSTITSGTTTRILYDNAGLLGEYTLTGTGTVVAMQTSPSITTSLITGSSTFALLNTTATTVNAFGATTTLNIGASAATVLNFGGSTSAAEFRFLEPSGSGTNYSGFKAQAQAANITYVLPATVGASGTVLTDAAGNGTLSWTTPSVSGYLALEGTSTATGAINLNMNSTGAFKIKNGSTVYFNVDPVNNITSLGDASSTTYIETDIGGATLNLNGQNTINLTAANSLNVVTAVVTIDNLSGTGSRAVLADAGGTLSAPISDRSVKQKIISLDYGLNEIMKLKPVSFEYKEGWKNYGVGKQIGFIAQDIQQVLPNSVFITKTNGKMGYNETDIIPILVKAIQEQQKQIDELKSDINKLKK